MAKPKFAVETVEVLDDLENRIRQFVEANSLYGESEVTINQNRAFESVLVLIDQIRETGKVKRESRWEDEEGRERTIPDSLESMVTDNKFRPQTKMM